MNNKRKPNIKKNSVARNALCIPESSRRYLEDGFPVLCEQEFAFELEHVNNVSFVAKSKQLYEIFQKQIPENTQRHDVLFKVAALCGLYEDLHINAERMTDHILSIKNFDNRLAKGVMSLVDDIAKYIKLGKLGEAFESDEQVILLIDEIDKADLEFPNDLLWELDQMEFYIHETKRTVKAKNRPIVIITSNAEKELPDAFLRRCIFHYIDFPNPELMEEIVRTHYPNVEDNLLKNAMQVFYDIRTIRDIRKKPSTSELIDWINALQIGGISADELRAKLPFLGVVVKKDEDLEAVRQEIH